MKLKSNKIILALGADIKSRYCIVRNNDLFISQDFGNLEDFDNFKQYKKAVLKTKTNFDVVVHDLHPGYFSTGLAESLKAKKKLAIQHHHAHIAAVLYSQKIDAPVIGIAFDGTGYGSDGNIWGGEFLLVKNSEFKRVAHFKYLAMPGGELAVKQPWRMAFSLIYNYLGDNALRDFDFLNYCLKKDRAILIKMLENNINCPLTSSVGRLFDAVSSILGVCHKIDYEAQAAIELEKLASKSNTTSRYELEILEKEESLLISPCKLVSGMILDLKNNLPKQDIAKKFHNSLTTATIRVINRISSDYNLRDVVLSGGVFANKLLLNSIKEKLIDSGYNLILDEKIPINDLSICLGQAYIASKIN
ncbi:MAG: hypothetical protein ABIA97_00510 [Candidatus Omnitrophota bacterium]